LPWAITYPQTGDHHLPTTPVHPTQLYDSALSLLLYVALAQLYRRKPFHGSVFAAYLFGYAITRSISELFRGDYPHLYFGWATPAHLLSVPIFITGLVLWFVLSRYERTQPDAAAKA
jgi:prolipoprotein diacylglyceryltransferase